MRQGSRGLSRTRRASAAIAALAMLATLLTLLPLAAQATVTLPEGFPEEVIWSGLSTW